MDYIFINSSLWALKICTLSCYTVICAKRNDRYVERPFYHNEKKNVVEFHYRKVKNAFFWSTTPLHRIMDSFVRWTEMSILRANLVASPSPLLAS